MSTKLFANLTSSLSKFLNKDYSGTINQETLDNLNEKSNVKELDILDEIKTPYKVSSKNLFEVTYGSVDKNITRLKSRRNKYKVQIQYNYKQYKEYLPHIKNVNNSINDGNTTTNFITTRANTLRDAITVRNKIRKTLPGRITVHSNGVRKIENTYKNTVKMSNATVSKDLPIGVMFTHKKKSNVYGFIVIFKTPSGEYDKKFFGVKSFNSLTSNSTELNRAKELAIAVRKEYEYHLVNSIPYYVNKGRFSRWWKLSEFEFKNLINVQMKKLM